MASLERVTSGNRDSWRLVVYVDKRRKKIGLGSDEVFAKEAQPHIEHLVGQKELGRPPAKVTAKWLERITPELHERLAALGIVEAKVYREAPRTVIAYMRAYIEGREDWKKPENYRQAVDKLEAYLGRDIAFGALVKEECERWHRWMIHDLGMSPNTAGQNVKRCRQMMRAAVDDRVAESNPFVGVKIDLASDKTKNTFIDGATARALLDACPCQEWRVLFALCRWGGLRNPSETLRLRWSDIAWDRGRFKVKSPKTARHAGKDERIVPLFPELRTELDALFSMVQPGVECPADSYVIQTYRDTEANMRKAIHRIADIAGVARWQKPFMALRASRRTELERSGGHANHVLNAWFGHSGAIAEAHYLQVTEEDFESAVLGGITVGTSQGIVSRPRAIGTQKKPRKNRGLMDEDGRRTVAQYTRQVLNGVGKNGGLESVVDPGGMPVGMEAELASLWARMDAGGRETLLAVARGIVSTKSTKPSGGVPPKPAKLDG